MAMSSDSQCTGQQWELIIDKQVENFNTGKFAEPDGFDNCAVCRNKRRVASRYGSLLNSYFQTGDCSCMDIIRRAELRKRSGMEDMLMRYGFQNFLVREAWQKQLLKKVKACAETECWLLLCGQSGCGKTHLAVALCRELLAGGKQVLYMSWPAAVREICAAAFDYEKREKLLRPFLDAPVLLLDDLFKTRLNDKGLPEISRQEHDLAFELIDHRYTRNKRTILTCEATTGKLNALSEAITGRILEKAGKFVQNIAYDPGRNMRTKPA